MKFKTTVSEVKRALNILSPIINVNHSTLAFRYILVRKRGEKIEFKGFNDYSVGSSFVNYYDIEEDTTYAYIFAKHFISLMNSFNKEDVVITITEDYCRVKCGKSQYKLQTLNTKIAEDSLKDLDFDYYNKPQAKEGVCSLVSFNVDDFVVSYKSVSHCLSTDSSTKILWNVLLHDNKMIACDGIKGAAIEFKNSANQLPLHKIACDCIANIKNSGEIELYHYVDDRIFGYAENFVFVTTLLSDSYPYDSIDTVLSQFDEKKLPIKLKINPDDVVEKLTRILMFADTDTFSIQVSFKGKTLSLKVDNNTEAEETINIFENLGEDDLFLYIDGRSLRELLMKSVSSILWATESENDPQFIWDGKLLQFFLGLEK